MNIQELCDMVNLLKKWKKEHAFCEPHFSTVDNLILWSENLIKIKVENKEL